MEYWSGYALPPATPPALAGLPPAAPGPLPGRAARGAGPQRQELPSHDHRSRDPLPRARRQHAAGHRLRAGRQERRAAHDRRVAAGREGPYGPAQCPDHRGRPARGGAGPGARRGRQVPRGRAHAGGRRLRADQLRCCPPRSPAGSAARSCSCRPCCTGWARRPSRASAAATWAAATWTSTTAASRGWAPSSTSRKTSIHVKAGQLQGAPLYLDTPSHTGTENLIMAAVAGPRHHGDRELRAGARGARRDRLPEQDGRADQRRRHRLHHRRGRRRAHRRRAHRDARPDRRRRVRHGRGDHRRRAQPGRRLPGPLRRGPLEAGADGRGVRHATARSSRSAGTAPLRPINVITSPYPGFATDLQSPIMALSCLADGTSYIRETIFDGRYALAAS